MTQPTATLAPLDLSAALIQPPTGQFPERTKDYDPTEEEPNFELVVMTKRAVGARYPHSSLYYGYRVEGELKPPLSQVQSDYMASMLRQVASLVQGHLALNQHHADSEIAYARQLKTEAKASMDRWANFVGALARSRDPDVLASQLGLDRAHIKKLGKESRLSKRQRRLAGSGRALS